MHYLWTPWRYKYMAEASSNDKPGCIFCQALALNNDEEAFIVLRGQKNFLMLNRYPYTSGHVMIVPYAHVAGLAGCDVEILGEMMELARRVEAAFTAVYRPDGMNLGMNLGRAAGAGVRDHVHLHVLPRWFGDANFITTIGETRVEPEDLHTTYERLRRALA